MTGGMDSLPEVLQRTADRLRRWQATFGKTALSETWDFLREIFDLGMLLNRNPSLRQSPGLAAFVGPSAHLLRHEAIASLSAFIRCVENTLRDTWYGDEWRSVCTRRSALEFLRELYSGTPFAEYLAELDLTDLDEALRSRSVGEGYLTDGQIPAGIPVSHAWWWYPEEPSRS